MRLNRPRRLFDVGKIGLAPLVEWGGNADYDGVHLSQAGEVVCRAEMFGIDVLLDFCTRYIPDVGLPAIEFFDLDVVGVEAHHGVARFGEA